jgi:hypothetical protein
MRLWINFSVRRNLLSLFAKVTYKPRWRAAVDHKPAEASQHGEQTREQFHCGFTPVLHQEEMTHAKQKAKRSKGVPSSQPYGLRIASSQVLGQAS